MKKNIYMSVSAADLQKMYFLLRETLTMMSRIYGDMVFSPSQDLNTFHHAVETVKSQYDQVIVAMEEHHITPLKGKSDFKE